MAGSVRWVMCSVRHAMDTSVTLVPNSGLNTVVPATDEVLFRLPKSNADAVMGPASSHTENMISYRVVGNT